jgi:dihydroxy-acid dehydratase
VGGPLALLANGDRIRVSVSERRIDMLVDDEEIARRRARWTQPVARFERGYGWMFVRHIKQANDGCDFDFLETDFGAPVSEPDIF